MYQVLTPLWDFKQTPSLTLPEPVLGLGIVLAMYQPLLELVTEVTREVRLSALSSSEPGA
jgi:hypothetical protein